TCLVDEETDEREEYSKDLALLDSRPSVRLKDLICNLRLNNGQCGLIRLNSLRRTGLDRPYRGGDITLMAELAILGKFLVLPEVLLFRRMGPTTFSRFLKKEGYKAFYGERANQALASHRLHRHFEILCAAMFYPIEWREKLASTKVAISQVFWDLASYRRHRSQPTSLS
ncbi:MAG TPA: hypothetical protein PLL01_11715, partial [Rhodoferax sp.]|nr:hypothetical protein [Rhodoferax sp.]